MQAAAGHVLLTGEPDGPPARCGLSVADLNAGLAAAFALFAAMRYNAARIAELKRNHATR